MIINMEIITILVVVASLALVGPPVECRGLLSLMRKPGKEWHWIDNFLKDGSSLERINKYFEENQATMEPKLHGALKLVVDAANVNPEETGCSEWESLKVAHLFDAINLDLNAMNDPIAKGTRKLAFETRKRYGEFCAKNYDDKLEKSVSDKLDQRTKTTLENFGVRYAYSREITREDLFDPLAKFKSSNKADLVAKALFSGLRGSMSKYKKELNKATGKKEYNWVELVKDIKAACGVHQGQVKHLLESIAKDAVASRGSAQLSYGSQIWHSWAAFIACERLEKFEVERVARKCAAMAA